MLHLISRIQIEADVEKSQRNDSKHPRRHGVSRANPMQDPSSTHPWMDEANFNRQTCYGRSGRGHIRIRICVCFHWVFL